MEEKLTKLAEDLKLNDDQKATLFGVVGDMLDDMYREGQYNQLEAMQ